MKQNVNTLLDGGLSRVSEGKSGYEDDSSSSGISSSSPSSTSLTRSRASSSDMEDSHVRRERHYMSIARSFIMGFLVILAAVAAYVWYRFDRLRQETTYEENFDTAAAKSMEVFLSHVKYQLETAAAVATSIATSCSTKSHATITAASNDTTSPSSFCGLSRFERRMAGPRRLAGATAVWWAPLLKGPTQRTEWEAFAEGNAYYLQNNFTDPLLDGESSTIPYRKVDWPVQNGLFQFENEQAIPRNETGEDDLLAPIWQSSPSSLTALSLPMFDQFAEQLRMAAIDSMLEFQTPVFSASQHEGNDESLVKVFDEALHVSLYAPIFDSALKSSGTTAASNKHQGDEIIGVLTLDLDWSKILGSSTSGVKAPLLIVLENTLGQTFTLESDNTRLRLLSTEGREVFENQLGLERRSTYRDFANVLGILEPSEDDGICYYRVSIYPTESFEDLFLTNQPVLTGMGIGGIILAVTAVFVVYDCVVESRQAQVAASAKRSNAIVKSLFPAGVRDRLMDGDLKENAAKLESLLPKDFLPLQTQKARIQSFLTGSRSSGSDEKKMAPLSRHDSPANIVGSEPIADFFPAASILFADLAGFTAWSSSREPSQVFTLLETLYGAMDQTARRLGVFKVETVGDCYVAATGIPDPRDDHAVLMVRFARSSLEQIEDLTNSLESTLGPGTGDLAMRVGIHSGPVTAGVLRGEKSRFQLFGDTMNIASRIESTGMRRRVHMSKDTADLLIAAGKASWVEERTDSVLMAQGKGKIATYWLKRHTGRRVSSSAGARSSHGDESEVTDTSQSSFDDHSACSGSDFPASDANGNKTGAKSDARKRGGGRRGSNNAGGNGLFNLQRLDRLVDYNVEVLIGLLKKIIARRSVVRPDDIQDIAQEKPDSKIALDEVKEVIEMPKYNAAAAVNMASEASVEIPYQVKGELRSFIHRIANSYNPNPFHNFEHASHVALSVNKLMKRIVMPDDIDYRRDTKQREIEKVLAVSKDLHEASLGLSSDPVTQFACVFVALIHDAGHTGVPNFVVAKEEPDLAERYRNKSLAEQRSIDIAWGILMEDDFKNLRRCLFPSLAEMKHFRQLIVNSVIATDIFDKELSALRKARWQKCFYPDKKPTASDDVAAAEESKADIFNRKATIVVEHIIQASDVAHTMQHWHVYRKWNERLFREMYAAYKDGRQDFDPSDNWYKGELSFFDTYVIPLAKKLDECGVFGVSSAEYLNYALENRNEWKQKGEAIVEQLVSRVKEGKVDT